MSARRRQERARQVLNVGGVRREEGGQDRRADEQGEDDEAEGRGRLLQKEAQDVSGDHQPLRDGPAGRALGKGI
ncbi:hypothetical protein [Tropicimonas sp. IMCC34011]|uniref:hypothetical protein n=1 Tax=Tropicimonas sp. IMCC34011 TaxID=2248759 RepID=UPI001E39C289|nr:hypothetical protein [Tropicimonas sp. IMCC34011]